MGTVTSIVGFLGTRVRKLREETIHLDGTTNKLTNENKLVFSKQAAGALEEKRKLLVKEHGRLKRYMEFENPSLEVKVSG